MTETFTRYLLSPAMFLMKICMVASASTEEERDENDETLLERILEELD